MPWLKLESTVRPAEEERKVESNDIVDIGVNLAHRSFQKDRTQIIELAFAAGVRTMIITGTSVAGTEAITPD
jgi:TatD DNase family protein